jgi:hypothetical protein
LTCCGDTLIRRGLRISRGGLVGVDLLFLGNFDGKSIRVEADLAGVQLTAAVANAFCRYGQTRKHGGDVLALFPEAERFFASNFGVVGDIDDRLGIFLLHSDGDQITVARDDRAVDFGLFAGFEFFSWGGCVSKAGYQKDERGKVDQP